MTLLEKYKEEYQAGIEEGRMEGRMKGLAEGANRKLIQQICRKLRKGKGYIHRGRYNLVR